MLLGKKEIFPLVPEEHIGRIGVSRSSTEIHSSIDWQPLVSVDFRSCVVNADSQLVSLPNSLFSMNFSV